MEIKIEKICTKRCIMTPICEEDFEEIASLFTNKDVREFLGGPLPLEWAFNKLNEALNKADDIRFTVRLKNTNACIGLIFITPHHNPSDKEISYMFFPEYWSVGYAFETVKAIIDYCKNTLNLSRVVSETQSANLKSCNLLEKLGFKLESKLEQFGAEQSIYSLELSKIEPQFTEKAKYVSYTVREAVLDDAEALADILCCAWSAAFNDILSADELAENVNMPERTEMFKNILKIDGIHNLIATEGNNPCGLCSYSKSRDNDLSDYGEIIAIHTKPEYWGKGVGNVLMDSALSELKKLGYRKIILWTFEENSRARRFYEKYGFVSDGTIKDSGFTGAKEVRYRLELSE